MVRSQPEQPFKGLIDIHRELSPTTSTEYESRRYYVRVLLPSLTLPLPPCVRRMMRRSRGRAFCQWTRSSDDMTQSTAKRPASSRKHHFPTFRSFPPSRLKYPLQIQLWHLRIAVHALADPGSLVDCVSLACDAAIRHFHYPDVAVLSARDVIVHEPVPLALDHTPFCISSFDPELLMISKGFG